MKKVTIAIIMATTFTLCAHAQIEWNDTVRNTSVTGYAGVLTGPILSVNDGKVTGFVSLRMGGTITLAPRNWVSFYGLGAGEINEVGTVTPLYLLGIKFRPIKIVSIMVGKIATPMTELRPLPTTHAGQFEPWTKSKILGSALGGKITVTPTKNLSLIAGGFWRNTDASIELGVGFSHVKIVGYYMTCSKVFGGATTVSYKIFSQTVVYNDKQNFAFVTTLDIPKTHGMSLYSDVGFDANTWKLVRGEWGILESFSYKFTYVLLGAGYSRYPKDIQSIKGYVMITL